MPCLSADRQGQCVTPVESIAARVALCGADDIVSLTAEAAVAQMSELPDALLCAAVAVDEVFVKYALIAIPAAMHHHGETLDYFAGAVSENAPGVDDAVEIAAQIQGRLFTGVIVDRRARATAGGKRGRSGG